MQFDRRKAKLFGDVTVFDAASLIELKESNIEMVFYSERAYNFWINQ